MPAIPKLGGRPTRTCAFCGGSYEDRGPGSGIKRDVCSVACERGEADKKAREQAAKREARRRQVREENLGRFGGSWTEAVFDLYGSDCLSCGADAQEAHHIVGRSVIANSAQHGLVTRAQLEWDPINGMPICRRCHELHTLAVERLYFSMLPAPAVDWAAEHGFASRVFDDRIYLGAPEVAS